MRTSTRLVIDDIYRKQASSLPVVADDTGLQYLTSVEQSDIHRQAAANDRTEQRDRAPAAHCTDCGATRCGADGSKPPTRAPATQPPPPAGRATTSPQGQGAPHSPAAEHRTTGRQNAERMGDSPTFAQHERAKEAGAHSLLTSKIQ